MTLIKASLQRSYAESFLTDLERNDNHYFLFVAKGTTWANENAPPSYTDTVYSENELMNNIIAYKKISPSNVVFALPRYEWTAGTSYDQYDDTVNLFDENDPKIFYVVTEDNHIFKCLGNSGGVASQVKPTIPGSPLPFSTSDGYRWKYLATLIESDIPYELTDYMPVDYARTSDATETTNQYNTQQQAIAGDITRIALTNASGACAGVYTNSIFRTSATSTATVVDVAGFTKVDSTTKIVKVTNLDSLSRIRAATNLQNYVGYAMRVEKTTRNPNELGNYGLIVGVTDMGSAGITFAVKNDAIDFVVSPTISASQYASVEITPFVRIIGDGSGAYASTVMNSNKTIREVVVVNPGYDYSRATAQIHSPKTDVTVHPTLRVVLSPKGGHGSNILKELNVKDVIVIIDIGEQDSDKFLGAGSYRQFGFVKNPVLSDGTNRVAGSDSQAYRDISLLVPQSSYSESHFRGDRFNIIVGNETNSSAKVVSVKSVESIAVGNSSQIKPTLKTAVCSSPSFISAKDRLNRYELVLDRNNPGYLVGETVRQVLPAGSVLQTGATYGFDLVARATVMSVLKNTMSVELLSPTGFVSNVTGATLEGLISRANAEISDVRKSFGEPVFVVREFGGKAEVVSNDEGTLLDYRVADVGEAYFDLDQTPSYSGLYSLLISSSVNSATGGIDITSFQLTRNSFSVGDRVTQGSTSGVSNYATGVVYHWDFINPSRGRLYVTDVLGKFISVDTHGLTGTTLGNFVVSSVSKPEIKASSGEVLYIENVRPIQRTLGQEEEFRIRLGF